ncbi:MAG: AAA family ATPase, partial [Nocardioides sp.]
MPRTVGRDEELSTLTQALTTTGTRVVLLMGEPGSGKTRLLVEAEAMAVKQESRVFRLRGFQAEKTAPLLAATRLLADLARHEPVLSDMLRTPVGIGTTQLFEIVHRVIGELGPVVLLVDDEQWLDATTLALVHFLVRSAHEEGTALCLVSATRLQDSLPLSRLGSSFTDLPVTRITLTGLAREDALLLMQQVDPGLAPRRADEMWLACGGSPFWMTLMANGGGAAIEHVIGTRLSACSAESLEMLELVAVAGAPVRVVELADMAGRTPADVQRSLSSLRSDGLTLEHGGRVIVAHDLIRETVVAHLDDARERSLHRWVADFLERSAEPAVLLAALGHRRAARLPIQELALRIVTSPQRGLLGVDGTLEVVRAVTSTVPHPETGLLSAMADLATDMGEAGIAYELWQRLAEPAGPVDLRRRAAIAAGRAAFQLADREGAWKWIEQARGLGTGLPGPQSLGIALHVL